MTLVFLSATTLRMGRPSQVSSPERRRIPQLGLSSTGQAMGMLLFFLLFAPSAPGSPPSAETTESRAAPDDLADAESKTIDEAVVASNADSPAAPAIAPVSAVAPTITTSPPLAARTGEALSLLDLKQTAQKIHQLIDGSLPAAISPTSLFDIPLGDEKLIQVDKKRLEELFSSSSDPLGARRLTSLIESVGHQTSHEAAESSKTSPEKSDSQLTDPRLNTDAPLPTPSGIDPARWKARLQLDRARLDFYQLSPTTRQELLANQAEKEKTSTDSGTSRALTSAEKEVAQAEKEEHEALVAAKNARSEAERSVHAELARLLGITKEQAEYEKSLIERRSDAAAQHDSALKLKRELSDKIDARESDPLFEAPPLDVEYVALRTRLKSSRDELGAALAELSSQNYRVPVAGKDRLTELPDDVDRNRVEAQRARITTSTAILKSKEHEYLAERARLLMAEVDMLNRLRLRAIPHLSDEKQKNVREFSPTGFDQARSEARQVWLTLLYHYQATKSWILAIRAGTGRGESAWTASLLTLTWLFPLALFVWWRKRSEKFLDLWLNQAKEDAKKQVTANSRLNWNLSTPLFLKRIHRPLEFLLLIWSVLYLLPTHVAELLEIQLPVTVMRWMFGGALTIRAIDALSSSEMRRYSRSGTPSNSPALRLRSLRLVGLTVVVFGLILSLSNTLVGKGTIYSWVFSTCWFAAIPVSLVIVAWWKPIIYDRLESIRKKGKLETWVLAQKQGATSFIAAILGGVFLFGTGAARVFRSWVVTFTIVRRILAYLFRRDMNRKAGEEKDQLEPLDPLQYATLGPEDSSLQIVSSVADEQIEGISRRIAALGGGVYAIVGERGSGKTTTMKRIARADDHITYVTCPTGGLLPFKEALNEALKLPPSAPFSAAAKQLDGGSEDTAVLVDDAQHLILPMMGGLKEFDRVLELARDTSVKCTWIFAVDEALWRFLERARGARPLFDEAIHLSPWAEPSIVQLIIQRNAHAGVSPSFQNLISNLPADADEVDIAEALQRTEDAYYRLLWDYASGNPGVALHFWRKSLGVAADGKVYVKLFQAAEAEDLEGLPDSAVFVLRATVQLGYASLDQVCAATALPYAQVKDALRYGVAKGYFIHEDNRYRITWNWFRAITRFLKRRHMLFSG